MMGRTFCKSINGGTGGSGARKTNFDQEYVSVPVKISHIPWAIKGFQDNTLSSGWSPWWGMSYWGLSIHVWWREVHDPSHFCTSQGGEVNRDVIGAPRIFHVFSGVFCLLNSLERQYLILVHSRWRWWEEAHFQGLSSGLFYYNSLYPIGHEINKKTFSITKYMYPNYIFCAWIYTPDGSTVPLALLEEDLRSGLHLSPDLHWANLLVGHSDVLGLQRLDSGQSSCLKALAYGCSPCIIMLVKVARDLQKVWRRFLIWS